MGACDRYFSSLGKGMTLSKGYWQVGGSSGRHSPTDMDNTYCSRTCCAGKVKDLEKFRERCALKSSTTLKARSRVPSVRASAMVSSQMTGCQSLGSSWLEMTVELLP